MDKKKPYNKEKVDFLLDEMEKCVERMTQIRQDFEKSLKERKGNA